MSQYEYDDAELERKGAFQRSFVLAQMAGFSTGGSLFYAFSKCVLSLFYAFLRKHWKWALAIFAILAIIGYFVPDKPDTDTGSATPTAASTEPS